MMYTVFVDSLYGSDLNTGGLVSPVRTLPYALSKVYEGGIIVIQTGSGSSYGDLSISKNITVKAAYGSSPVVGSLTLSGAQGLFEGLTFNSIPKGLSASNLGVGSLIVRECKFNSVDTPVAIDSVNYVALHRNSFNDYKSAIRISSAKEVCVSSNLFSNGQRSIDVNTVERLDIWKNTVYGALDLPQVANPDRNLRIIYKTLNDFDILYMRVQLPGFASISGGGLYDVAFNVVDGPSFNYGADYTVLFSGSMVSWQGLRLEREFVVGDVVRIMYSEAGDVESGDAIRLQNIGDKNSRVDSNSISGKVGFPINPGIYLNTPVKIRNNNFDNVDVWWSGAIPTGDTGMDNIGSTAMYEDPSNNNFRLKASSPNIGKGDSDRWNDIYGEMGIVKGDGTYTAAYTGTRSQVTPFDRDIDFDLFHRGATGIQGVTGDIGAFEFNSQETAMGNYVSEFGYDVSYPGTETGPYASPDRGYQRAGANDLFISTNFVPFQNGETGLYEIPDSGSSYSRFRTKNIISSDSTIIVGNQSKNDAAIFYPSHSTFETGLTYISPDGNDSWTGTLESPYRTVGRALQDNNKYVLVEPGYYPSFGGVTGAHLIGVEKYSDIDLNGVLYSNGRDGSWTGVGDYLITKNGISLLAPANVMGLFNFSSGIDAKLFITVKSDNLVIKILNNDNSAYVKINRALMAVTYGYHTGGVTYEVSSQVVLGTHTLDEVFSDLKVNFIIKGNQFSISVDGKYLRGTYSHVFSTGDLSNWVMQATNTGFGIDKILNINVFSDSLVGATGISKVVTLKKPFAITGATGIQL